MTIKELEAALGMTRANIRFYEKEGLLSPARLENGYRDYAQEDLETLRRIKLLRQLQFDLEDIRAFQAGTKDLTASLRDQEAKLQRKADDLEAAWALCRRMEEERVSFGALDAQKYLDDMAAMERAGTRFQSVEADSLPTVSHPWLRWCARTLDWALYTLLLDAILYLGMRLIPPDNLFVKLLILYLSWGLVFLLEPVFLCTWGTTPGKWVMGLTLRNADGGKLTWGAAMNRLSVLFSRGEGWGIPFYSLYRNYKSYCACADGETLPWDEDVSYTLRDENRLRVAGFLAGYAVSFALSMLMGLSVLLPPVRGDLTIAGFARNYNEMVRQYGYGDLYLLDEQGAWVKKAENGTYVLGVTGPPPAITYTLTDGHVSGIAIEYETAPSLLADGPYRGSTAAMTLALLGSRPGVNVLNWQARLRGLPETATSSGEGGSVRYGGLIITNQVAYSGYQWVNGQYLFPIEGEEQSYHQAFSIVLEESA